MLDAAVDQVHPADPSRQGGYRALELGGTLSGEHGIGLAKSRYMEKEVGRAALVYSRRIKSVLDPKNILNPGKVIGDASWEK